ncbi:MAG: outer membrane lipid asymmetry maintenance protein MlaD [Rhodobacteraceae bacterium]|jgi:phospholipid/cholesterol/gamma-HCH transport system substrate-binding protein|nr:outer membrane lipid asymmetry maintenance protein MlaD [Paracoccaceae bacterium]
MSHSAAEVLAGAAVLAVAAGFAIYAAGASGLGGGAATYPLVASFRSIEGISEGADVRLAGVKVGTLRDIRLNPQTYFADTTIDMTQGVELPADSAILISQDGLLGGSYVEILPGGAIEMLAPGDEIEDTQGAVSLISLLMKFVGGSGDASDTPAAEGGG